MSANVQKSGWTYSDYAALEDGKRYELISGMLREAAAPWTAHQRISRRLEFLFLGFLEKNQAGEIFYAPFDVILDDENVVQPDLVIVLKEHADRIKKEGLLGAPDLVVEILSPSTMQHDRIHKMKLYARFGVPEFWIVDPANGTVEVFWLSEGSYAPHDFSAEKGLIRSRLLPGFEVRVETLMEGI